jgi:spore coat protein A
MRILNGSNSRFYNLQLTDGKGNATGATMKQIGTDGGFLAAPVDIPTLLIAPGERADVIFDFNGENGNRVYLEDMPLPQNSPTVSLQPRLHDGILWSFG